MSDDLFDVQYEDAGAEFDADRFYRYRLWRLWGGGSLSVWRTVLWIMLNPSTADERVLDPTLRRCQGYSRAWGYDGFEVVNLFAFRATDPDELPPLGVNAIGPKNDVAILEAVDRADLTVCAWGNHGTLLGRDAHVRRLLAAAGAKLHCLRLTGAKQPEHPLYLPKTLEPIAYEAQ